MKMSYDQIRLQVPDCIKKAAIQLSENQTDPTVQNIETLSQMWEITLLGKPEFEMLDLYHDLKRAFLDIRNIKE